MLQKPKMTLSVSSTMKRNDDDDDDPLVLKKISFFDLLSLLTVHCSFFAYIETTACTTRATEG